MHTNDKIGHEVGDNRITLATLERVSVDDIARQARAAQAAFIGARLRRFGRWLRLEQLVAGFREGLRLRRRYADVQQLMLLDDRTLNDIGLRREDLWAVVHGDMPFEELTNARRAPAGAEVVTIGRPAPAHRPAPELEKAA
jgi:uncharacterized protein YjiS (DUF1127 family)